MEQRKILAALCAAVLSIACTTVGAQELPTARPEAVGMSSERLARIDALMQRHIRDGNIANAVTMVTRYGKVVHAQSHGFLDPGKQTPMRADALFRMASSSKPVTAVAVLTLVEEGLIRLSDPVSGYIPEFKNLRVAVPKPGMTAPAPLPPGVPATGPKPDVDYVMPYREITVRDLLTHTSGLLSGGLGALVSTDIQRKPADTLADYIPQLGNAALDFQPGTRWSYSAGAGFDTLGRIVEIASGKPFDEYLRARIFGPLGMNDTDFVIADGKQSRANQLFRRNAAGQWEAGAAPAAFASNVYFSGGGGLISTARDYARFEQMLLNGGTLNGKQVLAPRTVELMRTNQLGDLFHGMRGNEDGMGFGLGIAVTLDETKALWRRSVGSAGWYGAFGTLTWNDPREQIVAVLMIQQSNAQVQNDFGNIVMQAITESESAH
jgi:CubicO group peptidase (beta-lactamase class C family)